MIEVCLTFSPKSILWVVVLLTRRISLFILPSGCFKLLETFLFHLYEYPRTILSSEPRLDLDLVGFSCRLGGFPVVAPLGFVWLSDLIRVKKVVLGIFNAPYDLLIR